MHSRCVVHGSLPNTSPHQRVTLYMGFFPFSAVSHNEPEAIHAVSATLDLAEATRSEALRNESLGWQRRLAIPTAVALRGAEPEFAGEEPFDYALLGSEEKAAAGAVAARAAGEVFAKPSLAPVQPEAIAALEA